MNVIKSDTFTASSAKSMVYHFSLGVREKFLHNVQWPNVLMILLHRIVHRYMEQIVSLVMKIS